MSPRRRSSVDGGRPLGLGEPGIKVGGTTYAQVKRRLALIEPTEPGSTTQEQRGFVGAEPVVADFSRPGPGGWRQPE